MHADHSRDSIGSRTRPRPTAVAAGDDGPVPLHLAVQRLRSELQVTQDLLRQGREQQEQLVRALVSSRRVGAALGIIMAIRRVPLDDAFELISSASRLTDRGLRDVADDVIHAGEFATSLGW